MQRKCREKESGKLYTEEIQRKESEKTLYKGNAGKRIWKTLCRRNSGKKKKKIGRTEKLSLKGQRYLPQKRREY